MTQSEAFTELSGKIVEIRSLGEAITVTRAKSIERLKMAEMNSDISAAPVASVSESTSQAPAASSQTASEKMLPQSRVDEILKTRAHESYEKGQRDALAAYQKNQAANQPASIGGMPSQPSAEDLRKLVDEAVRNKISSEREASENFKAQQVAANFFQKLQDAKERYPDLQEVLSAVDLTNMAHIVEWGMEFGNAEDIVYDLAKNPAKLSQIESLYHNKHYGSARNAVKELSESIKVNQSTTDKPIARQPLSQLKPSAVTNPGSGVASVADLRKMSQFRR